MVSDNYFKRRVVPVAFGLAKPHSAIALDSYAQMERNAIEDQLNTFGLSWATRNAYKKRIAELDKQLG